MRESESRGDVWAGDADEWDGDADECPEDHDSEQTPVDQIFDALRPDTSDSDALRSDTLDESLGEEGPSPVDYDLGPFGNYVRRYVKFSIAGGAIYLVWVMAWNVIYSFLYGAANIVWWEESDFLMLGAIGVAAAILAAFVRNS
jgi:hypothetical protein